MAELKRCWLIQGYLELMLFPDILVLPIQSQKMPYYVFGSVALAQVTLHEEGHLSSDTKSDCDEEVLLEKLVRSSELEVVLQVVQLLV